MPDQSESAVDVVIIGGGAAGIMAALSVKKHHPDYAVMILDKTFELGRKFLTSGAGRGNLTNVHLEHGPDGFFHGDQTLIQSVFSQYGYQDILAFFEDLGVPVYEEKKTSRGKIFPAIDNAKTVRDMLADVLVERGIRSVCSTIISSIQKDGDAWHIISNTGIYVCRYIVIAAGGMTYPALGADGTGYDLARSLGHTIIPPVVVAVPIVSKNALSHYLQGEKMVMQTTSVIGGKNTSTAVGDVMFTQYGFSGPAIFDISHDFSVRIHREHKEDTDVRLSFFPERTREEAKEILEKRLVRHASFPVAHALWGLFTEKASGAICAVTGLPKDRLAKDMTPEEKNALLTVLTSFVAHVSDTRGWNEGEFTSGGVETSEIDIMTL